MGLVSLGMPVLSTYQGPWLNYPDKQKVSTRAAFEKKIMYDLFSKLPKFSYLNQRISYEIINWLPLYWLGFKQTTQYTHRLNLEKSEEEMFKDLDSKLRGTIKKAKSKFGLKIRKEHDIKLLYDLNVDVFKRQGLDCPFSYETLVKIEGACSKHNASKMLIAEDEEGNVHCVVYIINDAHTSYYLLSGSDNDYRNSGANSLLLWEAIKISKNEGMLTFDFEGSMIESVASFFRSFGAKQTPYFRVKYFKWKWLELLFSITS